MLAFTVWQIPFPAPESSTEEEMVVINAFLPLMFCMRRVIYVFLACHIHHQIILCKKLSIFLIVYNKLTVTQDVGWWFKKIIKHPCQHWKLPEVQIVQELSNNYAQVMNGFRDFVIKGVSWERWSYQFHVVTGKANASRSISAPTGKHQNG